MSQAGFGDLLAAKEQAQQDLMKLPGVHGVGIGKKIVNGQETDQLAITVFTSSKKEPHLIPEAEMIPAQFGGYPTDVVETPQLEEFSAVEPDTTRYRPCPGGAQLFVGLGYGTLGGFAHSVKAGDNPGDIYILSNRHVLHQDGLTIHQPTGGSFNEIGVVTRGQYFREADAAIAKVKEAGDAGVGYVQQIGPIKATYDVTTIDLGARAKKRGRTTRLTSGKISQVNSTVKSTGGNTLYNQIIIAKNQADDPSFSAGGDSGSLTFLDNADNAVIGLLWGGNGSITAVSPIASVLSELEISLIFAP